MFVLGFSARLLQINAELPLFQTLPEGRPPAIFVEFRSRIAFSARSEIGGLNTSTPDNGIPKSQNLIDRERRMAKTRVLMQIKLKSYRLQ